LSQSRPSQISYKRFTPAEHFAPALAHNAVERIAPASVETSGSISRIKRSIMKMSITILVAAALFLAASQTRAGVIAGPITNPANGHDYYLLTPNTWPAAEAEAEAMGGTLAIVRNAAEQEWIYSKFGDFGGTGQGLWIGLHRIEPGGKFIWVDGTPLDYTNWAGGEPNNVGERENCAQMRWDPGAPGTWNDLNESDHLNAVVEMRGRTSKNLTERERALIGDWYESGHADRPCHIAATDKTLFALNESNNASGRAFVTRDKFLFVAAWAVHGEVVKDKILWSNGTWWSRQPSEFGN
jgi:hypothetical protein